MPDPGLSGLWRLDAPGEEELARALVQRLGLKSAATDAEVDWRLIRDQGLWRLEDREGRRLRIDFDEPGPDYHRRAFKGRGELIAKALGRGTKTVADLSAGLGYDAVFLSQLGFAVTAFERNPLLAFLLEDARARTSRPDLKSLSFHSIEAEEGVREGAFDAAYFDPMYPVKKKSALPRQEMVLFRSLVGNDDDAATVAETALAWVRRLVVKRPTGAPVLLPNPIHAFEGSTVRYDVYAR